jgi:hypothetical protein
LAANEFTSWPGGVVRIDLLFPWGMFEHHGTRAATVGYCP